LATAFFYPLFWVFVAELGDKTQLVALCFATRFNTCTVMAGVFGATLVVHMGSVVLGGVADRLLPAEWVTFAAGLAFIGFGMWTIRGDDLDSESCHNKQGRSPFWIVATTFFLAELGDKTMLTTVAQAAVYPRYAVEVWIGSSLGMVVSDGLAILAGRILGHRLPERAVKTGAAILFFVFGTLSLVQGGSKLGPPAWAIGAAVLAVFAFLAFRRQALRQPTPAIVEAIESRAEEEQDVKIQG
jgi:putative Ca2+/H+ antiporter (TMEM165/GDT1 family)